MMEIVALLVIFTIGAISIVPFCKSLPIEEETDEIIGYVFIGDFDEDQIDQITWPQKAANAATHS